MANSWQLPDGVHDSIGVRLVAFEKLRQTLLSELLGFGYTLINPALIELFDEAPSLSKDLLAVDNQGQRLRFRSDITAQIERIYCRYFSNTSITRLCYAGFVVRQAQQKSNFTFKNRTPLQLGAELIGCHNLSGDEEVIRLGFNTLFKALPDETITLSLAHLGFLNTLIDEALSPYQHPQALQALKVLTLEHLKHKNSEGLVALFKEKNNQSIGSKELIDLMFLTEIGDDLSSLSVLDKLIHFVDGLKVNENLTTKLYQDLKELKKLIDRLNQPHLLSISHRKRIHIDLSNPDGCDYHKNFVFSFLSQAGKTLSRGGRYQLNTEKGTTDAVGFSLFLDQLPLCLDLLDPLKKIFVPFELVHSSKVDANTLKQQYPHHQFIFALSVDDKPHHYHCQSQLIKKAGAFELEDTH